MHERGHFRILGVPVTVEWPFFLVAAMLGLVGMNAWPDHSFVGRLTWILIWVAIAFVSVLVHELGHAIAFKLNHERSSIVLTAMWGLTTGRESPKRSRRIFVSLSGAVFAFLVLGLPFLLMRAPLREAFISDPSDWAWKRYLIVYYVGYANLWWSVANLLPVLPLDGGNVARELVGLRRARIAGVAVGLGLALWLWLVGQGFAALFIGMLGFMNLAEIMQERAGFVGGGGRYVDDDRYGDDDRFGSARPKKASRGKRSRSLFKRGRKADLSVVPPLDDISLGGSGTDSARLEAAAWDALRTGDVDEAARLLLEATGRTGVSPHLPAALAAAEGRLDDATTLFQRAFAGAPTPPNLVAATVMAQAQIAERVAAELLAPGGPGPDSAAGLQNHLHYAGCYREAALVGELLVQDGRRSRAQCCFETACAWSKAGEAEKGLEWLSRAVDEGFTARRLIDAEDDLAPVRALSGFERIRDRLQDRPS